MIFKLRSHEKYYCQAELFEAVAAVSSILERELLSNDRSATDSSPTQSLFCHCYPRLIYQDKWAKGIFFSGPILISSFLFPVEIDINLLQCRQQILSKLSCVLTEKIVDIFSVSLWLNHCSILTQLFHFGPFLLSYFRSLSIFLSFSQFL